MPGGRAQAVGWVSEGDDGTGMGDEAEGLCRMQRPLTQLGCIMPSLELLFPMEKEIPLSCHLNESAHAAQAVDQDGAIKLFDNERTVMRIFGNAPYTTPTNFSGT